MYSFYNSRAFYTYIKKIILENRTCLLIKYIMSAYYHVKLIINHNNHIVGFPNIIYTVEIIKQNYSIISKISLDRSRVV